MNNQTLENYVVERVKKLENEVSVLKDEKQALINSLLAIDEMKIKMRKYFRIEKSATGRIYIDNSYDDKYVNEIIEFIGLPCQQED